MMEFLPITALRNDGLQMLLSILYSLVLSVIFVPVMVISSNRNSNSARIVGFFRSQWIFVFHQYFVVRI